MKKLVSYLLIAISLLLLATGCKKEKKGLELTNTSWALIKIETTNSDLAARIATYQALPESQRPVFGLTFLSDSKLALDINYKGMPTISHNTDYAYKPDNGQLAINIESNGTAMPTNVGFLSAPSEGSLRLEGSLSIKQQKILLLLLSSKNSSTAIERAIVEHMIGILQASMARGEEISYILHYQRR